MPRPRIHRRLRGSLREEIYKPAGIPLADLQQVMLQPDELEALRLADLEGQSQAEGAASMGISRSTFQRILQRAHRQVALALSERRALRILASLEE